MASRKAGTRGKVAATKQAQRGSSNVFSMFEQAQIQEFKEAFSCIDQNRDGIICKADLRETYSQLGACTHLLPSPTLHTGVPAWSCRVGGSGWGDSTLVLCFSSSPSPHTALPLLSHLPSISSPQPLWPGWREGSLGPSGEHPGSLCAPHSPPPPGKVSVPEEELDAMLQEGKGPINFTVFLTLFGEKLNGTDPEEAILSAFRMFDPSGKGVVNKDEFKQLLLTQADKFSPAEVEQMFALTPMDLEGNIDYKSLCYIITHGDEKEE
ncbi:myosin regulatory light chain 2, atrial isoform isoform X1 [Sapajus apella]|uniref:Myosin regulatory light chain 2, atrial isoform isoform X1 n=1 Tax=Sapajus apella TaxID=9515 RepID=A0A6J3F3U9_SAPAP|nr:myosin regulatory light chain 2, atrial isoform isoform X1 [Sapajus apella]